MALITRFINTNSTPGGDGTTNDITGPNRAYASAPEWETAEQTNLVSDQDQHLVYCDGARDANWLDVHGWVSDAAHYITMQQHPNSAHNGAYDVTKYHLYDSTGRNLLVNYVAYTRFIGLQIYYNNLSGGNYYIFSAVTGNNAFLDGCLLLGDGTFNYSGINPSNEFTMQNCILRALAPGLASRGIYVTSQPDVKLDNCVFAWAGEFSVDSGGGIRARNMSSSGWRGTYAAGTSNNIDFGAAAAPGPDSLQNQVRTDLFTDYANGDLTLKSTSNARGAGIDVGLSNDIAGVPWGSPPSIGAHEFGASAVNLIIQDADHAQNADNIELTQGIQLVAQDAAQAQSADNIELTQGIQLVAQDAAQAQSADNIDLTQNFQLVTQDADHAHSAQNIDLTQEYVLVVDKADQAQNAENVELTAGLQLEVADTTHAHSVANVVLSVITALVINKATHAQNVENIDFTTDTVLVIHNTQHLITSDNVILGGVEILTPKQRIMVIEQRDSLIAIIKPDNTLTVEFDKDSPP